MNDGSGGQALEIKLRHIINKYKYVRTSHTQGLAEGLVFHFWECSL